MRRWKRPAAWLIAALLAFSLATLRNISFAADETAQTKESIQAASESQATSETAASTEEVPVTTEVRTETTENETATAEQTETAKEKTVEDENASKTEQKDASEDKTAVSTTAGKPQKVKKTASEDTGILIEGTNIYAQGTSIVIKKDSDNKAYVFDASGSARLSDTPITSGFTVYGGAKNQTTKGNVSIAIQNVAISTVYGGGYSDGTGPADLTGNVSIEISGNVNASKVCGGGYANASKGDASANVSGSVTVDIPSVPSTYHGNLYGGGYAYSSGDYNASADAGSVSFSVTGTTYSLRGGGTATSKGKGTVSADVSGSVSCVLKSVDVREVYGGGYADGANAHAKTGSVTTTFGGQNNEVMIFQGAGNASNGGCADTAGNVTGNLNNCSNIYGYVTAAGTAYSQGSANVSGNVSLNLKNSVSPVGEQFGNPVAAAFYGGGCAYNAGSHADVKGACSVSFTDCEIVGTILGGGESSSGGSAKTVSTALSLSNVKGSDYKGTMYFGDYIAGGEIDDAGSKSLAEPTRSTVTVEGSKTEFLWGGLLMKGNSLSSSGTSELIIKDSTSTLDGMAHFDTAVISHPLSLTYLEPKSDTVPTLLKASGFSAGDPVVTLAGEDGQADWLSLKNGKLSFSKKTDSVVWSVASMGSFTDSIAVENKPGTPEILVEQPKDLEQTLLTPDDKENISNGNTVNIVLKSEKLSSPPQNVKDILETEMEQNTLKPVMLLDLNLMKVTQGNLNKEEEITTLPSSVHITIDVPEQYQKEGRVFEVIRTHEEPDGSISTTILEDTDPAADKVGVDTDRFSVYSLVYKDENQSGSSVLPPSETTTEKHDQTKVPETSSTDRQHLSIGKSKTSSASPSSGLPKTKNSSYKSTAETGDKRRDLSSLLLLLSGSILCAGCLIKQRLQK